MARAYVVAAAVAALSAPAVATAGQATCSNPGLPVGATASSELAPGRLTVGLTTGLLPVRDRELLDDTRGAVHADSRLLLVETRLSAELALRPWLAIGVAVPYRIVDVDVTYRDPVTGAEVAPASATIHARDEQLRGLGDPSLLVHLAREVGAFRLHARVGASIPVGRTEDNPFLLGMIGQEHQHIQLGTGTVVPIVAVEAQRPVGPATLTAWALAQPSLYENAEGFRAADRASLGLTASTSLGRRAWTLSLAAEVHHETAEEWSGVVYEGEGNAGRTDVLAGAAAAWRVAPGLALTADVKVPVYTRIVGSQLEYPAVIALGVAGTFDLVRPPSWRGLDQAVTGPAGSATPLAPVAGRITVHDLWAAWCAPCSELDRRLEALARRYPDRLAVRKLDVVDPDSEAWKAYLAPGGFALPHIKVYGDDGTLLFERTASPAELVRAIEDVVRGRAP